MNAVNKLTGEVVEFETTTYAQLIEAYRVCQETIKAYEKVKKDLASKAEQYIENGTSEPLNGYMFRSVIVQRKNYDKAVLREHLDEDTYDLLLEPNKKAVDDYLKDNLETLGETSTLIRKAMIDTGNPYQVVRLEKI